MVEWNNIGSFERFEKANDLLKEVGASMKIAFKDEGKDIAANVIQDALKNKGVKNIKARDTIVFHVKDRDNKDLELWLSKTSYTNLRELKAIRDDNKDTLIGAWAVMSRTAKDDMTKPSFKFEKA